VNLIENVVHDIRSALRTLARSPAFALGAILTLALGVGSTTVAFSVVDSILLDPVPFKDPDRLVEIYQWSKTGGGPRQPASMLTPWREQAQIFDQVEAHSETNFALTGEGDPQVLNGSQVTVGLLQFLGVRPEIGRDFAADEQAARVAVISHSLWTQRFGSDSKIAGRSIHLDDDVYTIVGVMPPWFRFPVNDVQIWMPFDPLRPDLPPRQNISLIARLRQGLGLEQADARVATLARRLIRTWQGTHAKRPPDWCL